MKKYKTCESCGKESSNLNECDYCGFNLRRGWRPRLQDGLYIHKDNEILPFNERHLTLFLIEKTKYLSISEVAYQTGIKPSIIQCYICRDEKNRETCPIVGNTTIIPVDYVKYIVSALRRYVR